MRARERRRRRVPGFATAQRLAAWARSRLAPRALVLGYHRIARDEEDPFGLCTSPERFSEHLALLRREATPIGLDELLDGLERARLPRRAVVVTLDDGYADALHGAVPVLDAHGVAACVFVTSGFVGRVPWWEALAAVFPRAEALPERFVLEVEGRPLGWQGAPAEAGAACRAARIRAVYGLLLDWPSDLRERAIERLGGELEAPASPREAPRALAAEELRLLSEKNHVEIGAHGVHHPRLAELREPQQRFEIEESKRALEALTGRPVRAFSYPNGSSTPRTHEIVRESGFACAFGSHSGVAAPGGDRYRLPRFWVGSEDARSLARLLHHWG